MKGDTMEYNTENIKMRPNAVVEELLGRLPGLQIDANGNITFNGEKIERLLVDGEDIFGSDPTIITKNFNADLIAKVQLLERKSDQAIFTGIDDGKRMKTLNLVLKESGKSGYFGKAEAGVGPGGIYSANALLGSFRKREQFTVLGMAANTGILGFNDNEGGSGAGINFFNGNEDALGASAGKGVPKYVAGGLHYANTWEGSDDHVLGNYQYSHLFTQPVTTTITTQTLPDSLYVQQQQSSSVNRQDQHRGYAIFDYAPGSLSALKFTVLVSNTAGQNQFGSTGSSTFNNVFVNSSDRIIQSVVGRQNTGGSVAWRLRSPRQSRRTLSLTLGLFRQNNTTNGYLYSLNRYYQPNGSLESIDTTDQRKQLANLTHTTSGTLNVTEPLWKNAQMGLSYGFFVNNNNSLQATYNKGDGKYTDYVDSLSSHFEERSVIQQLSLTLQGTGVRFHYTAGGSILRYGYHQQYLLSDSVLRLHYINFSPQVIAYYTPDQFSELSFRYVGSTQQPTVTQLLPVPNNNDPLHIFLGNPGLRPSLTQNFNIGWKRLKPVALNLSLSYGITSNSISTRTYTDTLGRQVSQPVNTNGGQNAEINFSLNKRLSSLGIDAGILTMLSYARSYNYTSAQLGRNDNITAGGGLILARYVPDRYSIRLSAGFSHFDASSSVNTSTPTRYWLQNHSAELRVFLFRGLEAGGNGVYTWQERTSSFSANTSVLLLNFYISQNFLTNRLTVRAALNNAMDTNNGISRTNVLNVNTETTANIRGRYLLTSVIWHFNHKPSRAFAVKN